MTLSNMTEEEKRLFLRAEDIKARFLLYGHTVFAIGNRDYWTGFHWHPWVNESAWERNLLRSK